MYRWLSSCCMIALLSGCATLGQDECLTADWYQIGLRDGYDGQPRARLAQHREACVEYGILPNDRAYYSGRDQGLQQYCTPQRGFEVGSAGRSYQQVCTPLTEPDFMRGYLLGQDLNRDRQRLQRLESETRDLEQRLRATEDADERQSLRRRIRFLDEDMTLLRRQLQQREQHALDLGYR